jgi:long-chain acyl-CoA synthetase
VTTLPHVYPTVIHMLVETASRAPSHEALVCGDERLTYARYLGCVAHFSHCLRNLGAAGQRVGLLLGSGVDICIAMFAVHAAGAIAVPLNPQYTRHELSGILSDAKLQVLLYDDQSAAVAIAVLDELDVPHHLGLGSLRDRHHLGLEASSFPQLPEPLPSPDELASVQYTGGTTGRSKGVELTHRAIATNIAQRESLVPSHWQVERLLSVMPLFHVYGIAMCLHLAPYRAATLIIAPRYHPKMIADALVAERITVLAGSPTLYAGLLAFDEETERLNTDVLGICYSGGSALPAEILSRWELRTGTKVIEGYGQTEAGPVVSFNPQNGLRKPGSVGLPLPLTDVEIVDVEVGLHPVGTGKQGEIRVKGPQLMRGYRNLPEETAVALRGGWLYTGDIGSFDEQGYLYIRDRKKDMVIVSGFNVYPREVEDVLYLHHDVREAAVVGVADDYRGERLKAVVVLAAGARWTVEALLLHCEKHLIRYKVPSLVEFVDELPKTGAGKVNKKALRGGENP